MKLTPKQIHEGIENAKKCLEECSHPVVFYNCDDVGYPLGWVETWACLVCGSYKYNSTGGNSHCLGRLGHCEFPQIRVIVEVNNWFCKHYTANPYKTFDLFFKELRNSPKEKSYQSVYVCEGEDIEVFKINENTTPQEMENIISRVSKFL